MKIKVISDVHLEFSDFTPVNNEQVDVLILAGDIMLAKVLHKFKDSVVSSPIDGLQEIAVRFRNFLKFSSENYEHVIYIAGNHEFYQCGWTSTLQILKEECSAFGNVHFLENQTLDVENVSFIGCTLWTDLNKQNPLSMEVVRRSLNDFRLITHDTNGYRRINPIDVVKRHVSSIDYIRDQVKQNPETRFVVVGHHAPSFLSIEEKYASEGDTNFGFYSDLSEFILDHPQIELWIHGHTHSAKDYVIGSTRVYCNPRGYQRERGHSEITGWNPEQVIEL